MRHDVIAAVATLADGIIAGAFVGAGYVEQAAKALSAEGWIGYKQAMERVRGRWTPPLLVFALAASFLAALFSDRRTAFGVAVVLLVGVALVGALVQTPLNRAIQGYQPDLPAPAGWSTVRDRWRRGHWLRTGFAVAAFAVAVAALA